MTLECETAAACEQIGAEITTLTTNLVIATVVIITLGYVIFFIFTQWAQKPT